jgi:Holliday junction resolvase RusA-like endonuclease
MNGMPHKQKPDADNLLKSVLDAVYASDAHVWDIRVIKLWADEGSIEVIE